MQCSFLKVAIDQFKKIVYISTNNPQEKAKILIPSKTKKLVARPSKITRQLIINRQYNAFIVFIFLPRVRKDDDPGVGRSDDNRNRGNFKHILV